MASRPDIDLRDGALRASVSASAPYYRRRLRNHGFSIISNDCWGGAVYQHLGVAYHTPFVGLFVPAPCFLLLLRDLRTHLRAPLRFAYASRYDGLERERREARHPYPVGLLNGEVELHFVHYSSEIEARDKWERRSRRVAFDNLFIKLAADKDLCTLADLAEFDSMRYAHKLCLTRRAYPEIESAIRIPGYVDDGAVMYRTCLPYVNVVRWLNGGSARRRTPRPQPTRGIRPMSAKRGGETTSVAAPPG